MGLALPKRPPGDIGVMDSKPAANSYLRTKILTASPEELRMLLYDGAIKFCRQARKAIEEGNVEDSFNCLMRAEKIVLELSTSLNHDAAPEICEKLGALYIYIYSLLVDANVEKVTGKVDEAIQLLEYQRETWQLYTSTLAKHAGKADGVDQVHVTGAQQTAISSFSADA